MAAAVLTTDQLGQLTALLYGLRRAFDGEGCAEDFCSYERAIRTEVGRIDGVIQLENAVRDAYLASLRTEVA
jgi:hypothetical protein